MVRRALESGKAHARRAAAKPLVSWSVAEVGSWLEHTMELAEYVPLFKKHLVDGAFLSYLDKAALEELGVPSALHRLKLLTGLAQLPAMQRCIQEAQPSSDAAAVSSGASSEEVRRATLGLEQERPQSELVESLSMVRRAIESPRMSPSAAETPATGGHAASGWGIGEPAASSPLPPLHVSGAGGWVDGGATPQPVLRLVPPTPAGSAFASTPLQQLEQHQARQEELQQRRQSERGMLGGLMHQQRLEHHAAPEPEPEPEPAADPNGAARAQQQLQDWSVAQIVSWIAETMKLPAVAEAAAQEEVDGATAIEMGKEEWKELGSSGVKAAKLVGALKKLAAAHAQ